MLSSNLGHAEAWTYAAVVLAMLLLLRLRPWLRSVQVALALPGPRALPLVGNALLAADSEKLEELANTYHEKIGLIFRAWVSVVPFFMVTHPTHLQHILGSRRQTQKNFLYRFMHNFIGEGLITNSGNKWRLHRKLIQPCFHINILETFLDTFHRCSLKFVDNLQPDCDLDVTSTINSCVLDILHRAVLGLTEEEAADSPFRKGEVSLIHRTTRPWLLLNVPFMFTDRARRELRQKTRLREYTKKILRKRREDLQNGLQPELRCLLDMLIEISDTNPEFSEDDVINEACTFMLAGQDSVGAAVAFSLHHLSQHPDIQERAAAEVMSSSSDTSKPTLEVLKEIVYLEQCVKETLRLCPSVPMFARKLSEDVVLGKIVLPAGCNVFISPFATHRLPDIYPDPLKYNPDRFSPENSHKIHPYAYLPFSIGPRNCIGYKFALLEIKLVLSSLLRRYRVIPVPGREIKLAYRVTLRAKGGIWLRFTRREG